MPQRRKPKAKPGNLENLENLENPDSDELGTWVRNISGEVKPSDEPNKYARMTVSNTTYKSIK